ncbi:YqaA family protein [Paraferrimonas sedimenticola]|uniref:Membrane protein n=1 Tax=Paraferrimonas sedimenticola TaxID=375674 RepID=A0AA37RXG9_9GAMM|nr:YqaA family protein [Paraferrimonas sedimenticola]GLP96818.1 membrane protein [Paraferrimonas sedimenticola]
MAELGLMFITALASATILPGGSEAMLVGLLLRGEQDTTALLIVATLGNTIGSLTSYGLGYLGRLKFKPGDNLSKSQQTAMNWVNRYGVWSLLLAWTPVVGDLLCLLAGWLKWPVALSSVMILIGKGVRYWILAALTLHWVG